MIAIVVTLVVALRTPALGVADCGDLLANDAVLPDPGYFYVPDFNAPRVVQPITGFPDWLNTAFKSDLQLRDSIVRIFDLTEDSYFNLVSQAPLASYPVPEAVFTIQETEAYWCYPNALVSRDRTLFAVTTIEAEVDCIRARPVVHALSPVRVAFVGSVEFIEKSSEQLDYVKTVVVYDFLDRSNGNPSSSALSKSRCAFDLVGPASIEAQWNEESSQSDSARALRELVGKFDRDDLVQFGQMVLSLDSKGLERFDIANPTLLESSLDSTNAVPWRFANVQEHGSIASVEYHPTEIERAVAAGIDLRTDNESGMYVKVADAHKAFVCGVGFAELRTEADISADISCSILQTNSGDAKPSSFVLHIKTGKVRAAY